MDRDRCGHLRRRGANDLLMGQCPGNTRFFLPSGRASERGEETSAPSMTLFRSGLLQRHEKGSALPSRYRKFASRARPFRKLERFAPWMGNRSRAQWEFQSRSNIVVSAMCENRSPGADFVQKAKERS